MAARRLIFVMLVLLLASSIAAALVPVERDSGSDTSSSPTTEADRPPTSTVIQRTLDASGKRPATVRLALGDALALTVTAPRPDQVEIADLGELEDVDPGAPARFDLLPREPGTYEVRLLGRDRTVGSIEVTSGRAPRKAGRANEPRGQSDRDSPGSSTAGSTPGASSAS